MNKHTILVAAALALGAGTAHAETFKWAAQTDPQTMDPHAVNSAPVLGFLNNVYEGLVRRGKDMSVEPALAGSWEPLGGNGWRFNLRRGVTFHDGAAFTAYVEKVLVPELSPGTVVILDNLATHKNAEAEKSMRRAGCWFLFLPPYSPDLNPIEMAFSKLKAHLRRIGARSFTDMFNALADICDLYSTEECWNYFKAAGYVSN